MAGHNEQHKAVMDDLVLRIPGVSAKKTFGAPAYYVEGKMFACVVGDGVALKLPEAKLNEVMKRADAAPFAPGEGMAMGGWVQINRKDSTGYREDETLFQEAVEYVADLARSQPAKKRAKGK